ncbi:MULTISPECIES: hypothetical protein [Enterococcus]|uniref:hypothetical protein n=1 Tax=Enterococcus TaxID=1350 RepID=UPI000A34B1A8|nr:hypothetical protein [Enterococcus sp. 3C8_DIV0646]MBO1121833.1 hypothetical protein [Enterococcus casseliflavus]OTO24144.1 hypothetical protein A5876_002969 [Enterococcus sp. 3C8_DIV0646]
MNYFKNQLAKSVKQKTFLFLLIGAFSLGCCFSIYLKLMEPINLPATITAEKAEASRLVDRYQANQSGSPAEQEVYQLLLENNTLTSRQLSNLIMEEYERFNQTSIQIAELKKQIWASEVDDKGFLPPLWAIEQDQKVYQALVEQEKEPVLTAANAQTAVALAITFLLNFGFFFWAFFASDNLIEEREHFSLIRSYPQIFPIRMLSKIVVKGITNLGVLIVFFLGVFLSMSLLGEFGDWQYPVAVYLNGDWVALPFWQSVLYSLVSFGLLIGLIECLGFVMNMIAANRYVSFFLLVLFYGLGLIQMLQKIPLLPVHIAAMDKFYSGAFALGSGTSWGVYASWLLTVVWIFLCIALMLVADKQNRLLRGGKG